MKYLCAYCSKNHVLWILLVFMLLSSGGYAWFHLPRAENPGYRIRTIRIVTEYPGATPEEVLHEVTSKIENALQRLGHSKALLSRSEFGRSVVFVDVKAGDSAPFVQICDELRGKLTPVELPDGCAMPRVHEDYSDVREAFYAVTCPGASPAELHEAAKFLQKRLISCPDVGAIELYGVRKRAVYVRFSPEKMSVLKISASGLRTILKDKNRVLPEGFLESGNEFLPLRYAPENETVQSLGQTVITNAGGKLITLADIAEVVYSYEEPPEYLMYQGGNEAVGLGISAVPGGNALRMGEAVQAKIRDLEREIPAGFRVTPVSIPTEAIPVVNRIAFLFALSFALFLLVLIPACGIRFTAAAGSTVLLAFSCTLAVMQFFEIPLDRVRFGAVLFALGMTILNAIASCSAAGREKTPVQRADAVAECAGPLLAGTVLSLFAYALPWLSGGAATEFLSPLFVVLPIALFSGWLSAICLTPRLCDFFGVVIAADPTDKTADRPPRSRRFVRLFVVLLVCCGGWLFYLLPKSFYPETACGKFLMEVRLPYGTAIAETNQVSARAEEWLRSQPGVKTSSRYVGGGAARIPVNTCTPEEQDGSYAVILADADDARRIPELFERIRLHAREFFPGAEIIPKRMAFPFRTDGEIQARFSGPDFRTLERLRDECESIMRANGRADAVGSDWRNPLPVIVPVLSEIRLRRAGIDEDAVSKAILENFQGLPIGLFRERDELAVIYAQSTPGRRTPDTLESVQVWSPAANKMLPLRQLTDRIDVVWTSGILITRDRIPTVTVRCDASDGNAESLLNELRNPVEKMKLPAGYCLEWDGTAEESAEAWRRILPHLGIWLFALYAVTALYFQSFRRALDALGNVFFAFPGVSAALYLTNTPFNLAALCGVLMLCGIIPAFAMVRKLIGTYPVRLAGGSAAVCMIPFWSDVSYLPYALAVFAGLLSAGLLSGLYRLR